MERVENSASAATYTAYDGLVYAERRNVSKRRVIDNRRSQKERRLDSREVPFDLRKTVKTWFLSLIHSRLGVDRRKQGDRRKNGSRRQQRNGTILTREELNDLLS
jgi:hypothetical protein